MFTKLNLFMILREYLCLNRRNFSKSVVRCWMSTSSLSQNESTDVFDTFFPHNLKTKFKVQSLKLFSSSAAKYLQTAVSLPGISPSVIINDQYFDLVLITSITVIQHLWQSSKCCASFFWKHRYLRYFQSYLTSQL